MVVHARYDWRDFDAEARTEPDVEIPCAVLISLPRDWTTDAGTVCARYGRRLLEVVWLR